MLKKCHKNKKIPSPKSQPPVLGSTCILSECDNQ